MAKEDLILQKLRNEVFSPFELLVVDKSFQRSKPQADEMRGAAVGIPKHVALFLQKKRFLKKATLLERLDPTDDPQCALRILRHCLASVKKICSRRSKILFNKILQVLRSFDNLQGIPLKKIRQTHEREKGRFCDCRLHK